MINRVNDEFKWINFYMECRCTEKSGYYSKLLDDIRNVIREVNTHLPEKNKLKELDVVAIDPFTIYGFFNRDISDSNRLLFLQKI